MNILQTQELTRTFKNGKKAFENIDITIKKGEIVGILGTSGCGKSSLLRVLAGLDSAEGSYTLYDKEIKGISPNIGLVFQEPRLLPWLSVKNNALFGLESLKLTKEEREKRCSYWLEKVGLTQAQGLFPKQCSGGMAQRVALARTLSTYPDILLLDEPFSALDAFIRMQLQDLLLNILTEEKTTMIIVTHDIDEALYLCDRILILRGHPGKIVKEIHISQSRPRMRGDTDLAHKKEEILELLDLNVHHTPPLLYNI